MSNTENPSPEQLREEVERTREDLADTVDELAARLDVKSRVRESVHDTTERVRESATDAGYRVREAVTEPDGSPRPAALAVVGAVAAFIVAALVVKHWRSR
ncbi:DUF3618 domain-containing protein [Aeromicrobium sp.]|uniref:DUF3618 domain-containing protein n=1 Tax=Aeromicrobium sp. TaxID=1871063 RepID=UPI0028A7107B|nr:DUF3618 domain-containing protein [Aeromicrobium sp.]